MVDRHASVWRRTWLRRTTAGVVVAVVTGGAYAVHAAIAASPDSSRYRTSVVASGSIDQRLPFTGTATRLSQVTAAFPVSGAIASVDVALGDTVRAGQTLATLRTTALDQAVLDAKAALAQAQAQLESDSAAASTSTTGARAQAGPARAGPARPARGPAGRGPALRDPRPVARVAQLARSARSISLSSRRSPWP